MIKLHVHEAQTRLSYYLTHLEAEEEIRHGLAGNLCLCTGYNVL